MKLKVLVCYNKGDARFDEELPALIDALTALEIPAELEVYSSAADFFDRRLGFDRWIKAVVIDYDAFVFATEVVGKGNAGVARGALDAEKTCFVIDRDDQDGTIRLVGVVAISEVDPDDWRAGWALVREDE